MGELPGIPVEKGITKIFTLKAQLVQHISPLDINKANIRAPFIEGKDQADYLVL